jgi:Activator of Hsp90 ATPase homolog 1-like protein
MMHGPDGSTYPNENLFRELQTASKVVIQHVSPPHFRLTVTLAAHPTGTGITWVQEFEDPAMAARVRHIVAPANEQNLDRLLSVLAGGSRS